MSKPLDNHFIIGYSSVMRGKKNQKLNGRIVELWNTGRYKSYSSLARVLHTYPKAVERAIKKVTENQ